MSVRDLKNSKEYQVQTGRDWKEVELSRLDAVKCYAAVFLVGMAVVVSRFVLVKEK